MSHLLGTSEFKNFIICGDFATNPWSLGNTLTSVGFYSTNRWDVNRWSCWRSGAADGLTCSKVSIASGSGPETNYALRLQRAQGNTSTASCVAQQSIESIYSPLLRGNWCTFSFWARAGSNLSSTSNALISQIGTGTGTDQPTTVAFTGAVNYFKTFNLTTSWQKFTHTVFYPSNVNQICPGAYFDPTGTAGANDYVELALFQFEIGQLATSFDMLSSAKVLRLSQRYYEKTNFIPGIISYQGYEFFKSRNAIPGSVAGQLEQSTRFIVPKRAIPTTRVYGDGYLGNTVKNGTTGFNRRGCTPADININGFSYISVSAVDTPVINLDDQIAYHWDARAEI